MHGIATLEQVQRCLLDAHMRLNTEDYGTAASQSLQVRDDFIRAHGKLRLFEDRCLRDIKLCYSLQEGFGILLCYDSGHLHDIGACKHHLSSGNHVRHLVDDLPEPLLYIDSKKTVCEGTSLANLDFVCSPLLDRNSTAAKPQAAPNENADTRAVVLLIAKPTL
eukprot:CAMPEP_0115767394 /NCGR_PEP_ID=MMETSP0272-20121206/103651_1 /TAXON_ID=71861 /ORGANISM="Scrippsiella trochoidea, Strain CCMP3099" /LENGTH=163 /DNA_ID=CAMNT_0003213407 /DNA_START=227 /DNA_END=719 /DNA_ORIENTATION=+